jgi:hypothetical protein
MIKVGRKNDEKFKVTVSEQVSSAVHTVTLDGDYYQVLTDGQVAKEDFIKKCFEFLLEREGKELPQKNNFRNHCGKSTCTRNSAGRNCIIWRIQVF